MARKLVTLGKGLSVLEIDKNRFNYLFAFGHADGSEKLLETKYRKVEPGEERTLTRENCLEIAFISALTEAGMLLVAARHHARELLSLEKAGKLPRFWVRNWRGRATGDDDGLIFSAGEESIDELALKLKPRVNTIDGRPVVSTHPIEAERIYIVNFGEVVRRIDALFSQEVE